jgi:hypothetical protein
MAEMHPWKANERSQIPAYDKLFNEIIAPIFEDKLMDLINSEPFKKGTVAQRRQQLTSLKGSIKTSIRKHMTENLDPDGTLKALKRKATISGNKNSRSEAKKFLEERYGYTGSIQELEGPEAFELLQIYFSYIKMFEEQQKRE